MSWCDVDDCPPVICGGPHIEVATTFGTEIVREGQPTIGIPLPTDDPDRWERL